MMYQGSLRNFTSHQIYRIINGVIIWSLISGWLLVVPAPVAGQSVTTLFTSQYFGQSEDTLSTVLGDLNGDGSLDIVMGNSGEPNTIYFNDGKGNFETPQLLERIDNDSHHQYTNSIALGDLNGDGALDIATSEKLIYLNEGQGAFGTPLPLEDSQSYQAASIALGDLNGDGTLDIVAGNYDVNTIYLNNGNGNFSAPQPLRKNDPDGDYTASIALGDLNGDGALDIVAGNGMSPVFEDFPNTMYLNNGQGNFTAPQPLDDSYTGSGTGLALGDINGDSALDIIIGGDSLIYLNDGQGDFATPQYTEDLSASSIALGNLNGDGEPDIVAGSYGAPSTIHLNEGEGIFATPQKLKDTNYDSTSSIVVGDLNGDGALDIVTGNDSSNTIYFNKGHSIFTSPQPLEDMLPEGYGTYSVAIGDLNGDGALDIIAGNNTDPNTIYLNKGDGSFAPAHPLEGDDKSYGTYSIAVGDLNGDGALDIVAGNSDAPTLMYLNNGDGSFTSPQPLSELSGADSVAMGDVNGDGALDIIDSTGGFPNTMYLNNGEGSFASTRLPGENTGSRSDNITLGDLNGDGDLDIVTDQNHFFGAASPSIHLNNGKGSFAPAQPIQDSWRHSTDSIAVSDFNGDGALDIVVSTSGSPSRMYLNDGRGDFAGPELLGDDQSDKLAVGDFNGDGAFDIVAGREKIYLNQGNGTFGLPNLLPELGFGIRQTNSIAVGDLNGDGALDIVTGNVGLNAIFLNAQVHHRYLPNNPPMVSVSRPGKTGNANFFSTTEIISETNVVEIPYTLFDPEGDPVQAVSASYSFDGGGKWYPAIADEPPNLTASPDGTKHVFKWNLLKSGFFGASDNVVFRITAYPGTLPSPHGVSGPYLYPYVSATTFPFRVHGTQVQVVEQGTNQPITGAQVYRLPVGQARNAHPLLIRPGGPPLQTNGQGYLSGRSIIELDDQLIALAPITSTSTYTLYQTSAAVTTDGLDFTPVQEPGTQTLAVSADNAFLLFNLTVSLEWDARRDQQYLLQLEDDLKRASELLFDWSDGQVALGQIKVYQNREHWNDAHIRVYATNRMRPSATKGGIVDEGTERPDPADDKIVYRAGQVRMGAVWNRYGDTDANLGEDWPRALAHELGHFALFLDDNYLGIKDGTLVSVASCPGAMSDPYLPDNDDFHPRDDQWDANCQHTLSEYTTGRADWETIKTFYDQPRLDTRLRAPHTFNAQQGPSQLPLAVTQVTFAEMPQDDLPLDAPIFRITDDTPSRWSSGPNTRAVLFQDNRLIDLGQPTRDQITARGAHIGDRLCIYASDKQQLGCQTITTTQRELHLTEQSTWQPDIRLTPVTSTTLQVEVQDFSITEEDTIWAQIYPATTTNTSEMTLFQPIQLRASGERHVTQIRTPPDQPTFEGHVHVWVNNQNGKACSECREAIVDYFLGGNPGRLWARTAPRGNPGRLWARTAPILSSDGQAIIYGDNIRLEEGEFFTLQSAVRLPTHPLSANPVGRAYRLTATSDTMLEGTSLNIGYQGDDVPDGEEGGIRMYMWNENITEPDWTPLDTQVDVDRNQASAQVQGPGVYMLMSSITIPLESRGWQLVPYPGQTQPVADALAGVAGHYTTVYSYEPSNSDDPWQVYDVDVPEWVNDLEQLEHQRAYWINVTKPTTLPVKGPRPQTATPSMTTDPFTIIPPATYYMTLQHTDETTIKAGLPVVAWMGGQICGRTTTRVIEDSQGAVGFVIDVVNTGTCNVKTQTVTFTIDKALLPTRATWSNQRPQQLTIFNSNPTQIYLPLLQR